MCHHSKKVEVTSSTCNVDGTYLHHYIYRKMKDGRNTTFLERVRTAADFLSLGTGRIHSASGTVPSTSSPMLLSVSSFMFEGHIVEPSLLRCCLFIVRCRCFLSSGSCKYSR